MEHIPVGAIIPFFLTPKEITDLAPEWLPVDGTVVTDDDSPLKGKKLPDLTNCFVLGSPAANDVTNVNANTQGPVNLNSPVNVQGTINPCGLADIVDRHQGTVGTVSPPYFVIDTATNETDYANHIHQFSGSGSINTPLPLPPFSRLVYLIRARGWD